MYRSCRAEEMPVLSQLAERMDSALQLQPVRVKANGHTRAARSAREGGPRQQKGKRIAGKLGIRRDRVLRDADPWLGADGFNNASGANNEIIDAASGDHFLGRKLQFAPSNLRPGGTRSPIRSAVAHRNPTARQPGAPGDLEATCQALNLELPCAWRQALSVPAGEVDHVCRALDQGSQRVRLLHVGANHFRGGKRRFQTKAIGAPHASDDRRRNGTQIAQNMTARPPARSYDKNRIPEACCTHRAMIECRRRVRDPARPRPVDVGHPGDGR